MALFVQIDHFRKTDQKPTVKNHLFSISWFRSFNRTSFQQQLKQAEAKKLESLKKLQSYILSTTTETVDQVLSFRAIELQSYILSTTTETNFNQRKIALVKLQSYILSTTTETYEIKIMTKFVKLQSYILSTTTETWQYNAYRLRRHKLQSYILSTTTET